MSGELKKSKLRTMLGQNLRVLRKKKGWSQEELGFRAKIHRTYVGAIERGEQNVSVDNIARLANALRVRASTLFNR